jgi:ArsR family transcriptional regulator
MARPKVVFSFTDQDMLAMSESAREASDFLKALAHESRLMILCNLVDGEKHVQELEQALDIRQSTVSQQLSRLRLEGLVSSRRDGKLMYYSLANKNVTRVIGVLVEMFCKT